MTIQSTMTDMMKDNIKQRHVRHKLTKDVDITMVLQFFAPKAKITVVPKDIPELEKLD
jgi:hypothetical protein